MKTVKAIITILDYILYSEMEGKIDKTDPWYSTYENLEELKQKIIDEEDI